MMSLGLDTSSNQRTVRPCRGVPVIAQGAARRCRARISPPPFRLSGSCAFHTSASPARTALVALGRFQEPSNKAEQPQGKVTTPTNTAQIRIKAMTGCLVIILVIEASRTATDDDVSMLPEMTCAEFGL